jgi:hypothetical protein
MKLQRVLWAATANSLLWCAAAAPVLAGPYPAPIQNDVYSVTEQGGSVNGIPTARDDNPNEGGIGVFWDIHDAANILTSLAGMGSPFTHNQQLDGLFVPEHRVWTAVGGGIVAMIGLTAGSTNTLGIYTDLGVGNQRTNLLGPSAGFGPVGNGTQADPFPAAFTGLAPGQSFGWFLHTESPGAVPNQPPFALDLFSEPNLNQADGPATGLIDHLMVYDASALNGTTVFIDLGAGAQPLVLGPTTFLLAWEDLAYDGSAGGLIPDDDYDDMVYLITAQPVPEPQTWLLLALALPALAVYLQKGVRE